MTPVNIIEMNYLFAALLLASILHMLEEYVYPGGFMDFMKRMNPTLAPAVTAPAAVVINGLQLILCIIVIFIQESALVFSMSLAGLLFINGLVHIGACLRARGYAPGVITGILLYLPLSTYAYHHFMQTGQLTWSGVVISGVLALLFQLVPPAYFGTAAVLKRT